MLCNKRHVALGLALALSSAAPGSVAAAQSVQGQLVADHRGQLAAQITGERSQRVQEMTVRVGDRVKKNDVLARLDTEQLVADRLIAQRTLDEARAAVSVAKAAVARAQLDFNRRSGLKDSAAFNRAAFEDAEVALQAAQGQLESAERNVGRREAEIERINLEIQFAEIKAPYDAIVLEILTSVGATVTQQNPALLSLQDLTQVEIAVPLTQGTFETLKPGQSLNYSMTDGAKKSATVRAVLPPSGDGEQKYVARLQLDPADLPLAFRDRQAVEVFLSP